MNSVSEITHLINQYGFTIDTGDVDGFAALFEHAEWVVEGAVPNHGKEDMLNNVVANVRLYEDGTPKTKHVVSNVELNIEEVSGTATAQSYVTLFQQTDTFALQAIFCGHYFDEFERVGGDWRFKKRVIRHVLVGDLSAHLITQGDVVPD
jgi:hypothetical protein